MSRLILYQGHRYRCDETTIRTAEVTKKPWVLYHGTSSDPFEQFNPSIAAKGEQFWNPLGDGLYCTNEKYFAGQFGSNIHEVVIPIGARYKRIAKNEWRFSVGHSLVTQALKDAFRANGETFESVYAFNRRLGSAIDEIGGLLARKSPYDGLYQIHVVVAMTFGKDIGEAFAAALPKRANQKFKQYDFVVFTESNDAIGNALEVVVYNSAMQKARPSR